MKDPAVKGLFSDCAVPDGLNGDPRYSQYYTQAEQADLAALAGCLSADIASGKGVNIYFDNDGTLFPFVKDPKDVAIDPDCYRALVRLKHLPHVMAMSLTGREVHEAGTLMLTPGLEVRDQAGKILAQNGDTRLHFAIAGSHGVECLAPDAPDGTPGPLTRHDFSATEKAFIKRFQDTALAFKENHPGLTVEIKHGAVGINAATLEGATEEEKAALLGAVLDDLKKIVDEDNAPRAEDGRRIFAIRREGNKEIEIRPVTCGKDFGIKTFGDHTPGRTTVFLCDSLGAEGTDTPAAALVNGMKDGMVLMVRNGRLDIPAAGSPGAPRAVFANPGMLGRFLTLVADQAERACAPAPVPAPAPQI